MNVIPSGRLDQIQFAESHAGVWSEEHASIGLGAEQLALVLAQTLAAREAYDAALSARQAAEIATQTMNSAVADLRDSLASAVRSIKAFALAGGASGASTILAKAQIPEPKNLNATPRTPPPPPGVPDRLAFALQSDGSLRLTWEATHASTSLGAYFIVSRRLPGEADYREIGVAPGTTRASRSLAFTDTTLPSGASVNGAGPTYVIEGRRGDQRGPRSTAITVAFGNGRDEVPQRRRDEVVERRAGTRAA